MGRDVMRSDEIVTGLLSDVKFFCFIVIKLGLRIHALKLNEPMDLLTVIRYLCSRSSPTCNVKMVSYNYKPLALTSVMSSAVQEMDGLSARNWFDKLLCSTMNSSISY